MFVSKVGPGVPPLASWGTVMALGLASALGMNRKQFEMRSSCRCCCDEEEGDAAV